MKMPTTPTSTTCSKTATRWKSLDLGGRFQRLQELEQRLRIARLAQKMVKPSELGEHLVGLPEPFTRNRHEQRAGRLGKHLADLSRDRVAADTGHVDVEDDRIRPFQANRRQDFAAAEAAKNAMPLIAQD